MVHALEQIWEALAPDGVLIDLRPVAARWPLDILAERRVLRAGRVDDSPNAPDDRAADAAIRAAVRRGLFRRVAQATFPFDYVWDSVTEMTEHVTTNWHDCAVLKPGLLKRAQRLEGEVPGETHVRITLRMILRTYHRLERPRT